MLIYSIYHNEKFNLIKLCITFNKVSLWVKLSYRLAGHTNSGRIAVTLSVGMPLTGISWVEYCTFLESIQCLIEGPLKCMQIITRENLNNRLKRPNRELRKVFSFFSSICSDLIDFHRTFRNKGEYWMTLFTNSQTFKRNEPFQKQEFRFSRFYFNIFILWSITGWFWSREC